MVIREYEGRTEREAVNKAVEDLGASGDKLKIEVITEKQLKDISMTDGIQG